MSNFDSGAKKRMIDNQVFHIRIGATTEKLDIKDPAFLKLLKQEYATKYLNNLGVEANIKNINRILKEYPLEKCEIVESRMNGGLHTDTITIRVPSKEVIEIGKGESQNVSNEMLQILNLKRMHIRNEIPQERKDEQRELVVDTIVEETHSDDNSLEVLQFGLKEIKERYIFPFNDNFKRRNNYKMKDSSNLIDTDRKDSKIIFEARVFCFPFTEVKLSLNTLKELQTPIGARLADIILFLEKFARRFPRKMFPISNDKPPRHRTTLPIIRNNEELKPTKADRHQLNECLTFLETDITRTFDLLRSESNAKMIGVLLHLCYWCIFGGVNPIQIDSAVKKKMYILIFETLEYFSIQFDSKKLWGMLVLPMILLTLKMSIHYFFAMQYPKLFQSEEAIKVNAHELAVDKILYFVEKLFDQSNINGRFIFLESSIDGEKGNFTKDKKFIRKRVFGVSPALSLILPEPRDGRTRSIMARNLYIDQQDGTIEDIRFKSNENIDKESQKKLLDLALHKINHRLEDIMGNHGSYIINLKQE